tara:strand:+ start:71 stop:382 length:312 start_codon:yes stop_codon:yes gene_type:complete
MTDAPIDDEIRRILTIWDHQNGTEIVKARQIFRLGHTATEKDVKKAWKQLSLRIHPDKCRAAGGEDAFKACNLAKDRLLSVTPKERPPVFPNGYRKCHSYACI